MYIRKCPFCEQEILPNDKTIPYKRRTAHVKCFNSFIKLTSQEKTKQITSKKKTKANNKQKQKPIELKDALSEEEYKDKQDLYKTIRRLQNKEEITAKTHKLISDYMNDYKFTFQGITQSLEFFYDIQGNLASDDVIGIIPYVYDEAQEFFCIGEKTLSNNTKADLNNVNSLYKEKVVCINPKQPTKKFIDINSIG